MSHLEAKIIEFNVEPIVSDDNSDPQPKDQQEILAQLSKINDELLALANLHRQAHERN